MLVNFVQNLTLIADQSQATTMYTDPMPVGNPALNRLQLTLETHRIIAMGTPPTFSLAVTVEGSNDGVTWFDTNVSVTKTDETAGEDVDAFDFGFARIKLALTCTGSAGDWVVAMFDVHGNFVSS